MKIIATLAMIGLITATEVETLKNAEPYQLAELDEMLAQVNTEAGLCYKSITRYHAAIKNYLARLQNWINENKADSEGASSESE
jgi:hypothetical protein